jgi:DSF synthase
MHALGVVDIVAGEGGGDQAVREHIAGTKARRNAHAAVNKVRRQSNPATFDELRGVVDIWVDAALSLTEHDLRKMDRIARAQDRFQQRNAVPESQREGAVA